jgi:hypothetical protein
MNPANITMLETVMVFVGTIALGLNAMLWMAARVDLELLQNQGINGFYKRLAKGRLRRDTFRCGRHLLCLFLGFVCAWGPPPVRQEMTMVLDTVEVVILLLQLSFSFDAWFDLDDRRELGRELRQQIRDEQQRSVNDIAQGNREGRAALKIEQEDQ